MNLSIAGSHVHDHLLTTDSRASIATIARIPYVHTLADVDDFLWATFDVALWSGVETALGITAASCATLRPLLRKIMPSLGFTTSNSRSRGGLSQSGLAQSGPSVYSERDQIESGNLAKTIEGCCSPSQDSTVLLRQAFNLGGHAIVLQLLSLEWPTSGWMDRVGGEEEAMPICLRQTWNIPLELLLGCCRPGEMNQKWAQNNMLV